jgi:DNA cross-link repair 1A protein
VAKAQEEFVPQTDEDEEEGSEAGDELNCTQLGGGDRKSPVDAGVGVACSDDEDDDVPLIQLVRQSIYHSGIPTDQNEEIKLPFGGSAESAASSNANDTKEIRTAIDDSSDIIPPFLDTAVRSSESTVCFICGASLLAIQNIKGRLAHVKRCSKKNGVSAKDIRWNDDHEMFIDASSSVNSNSPKSHLKNPYAKHSVTDPVAGLTTTPALASVNNILMENARRAARIKKIQAAAAGAEAAAKRPEKQPWWQARNQQQKGACPWYKMIPNTDFCVDGFNYAPRTRNFFLSHFHSDHYGGITSAWDSGTIYCSLATANLVSQQLGVDRKFLHPLPPSQPVVIESQQRPVTVTTIDANHCPGAVMFLFQVGNKNILHVGDFRWNREVMQQCQPLRPFFAGQSRLDSIYLDTTYCDPKYTLPTQDAAIQEAIRFASREYERARSSKTSLLMLFGAYTIGKERIYM